MYQNFCTRPVGLSPDGTTVGRWLVRLRWLCWLGLFLGLSGRVAAQVVINEIMYHPASENVREEYIELYNRGGAAVSVTGWQFTKGIRFTFPSRTISAGGFLVVAADLATFTNKYPGITNVVGGWNGILSNSRNVITLNDAVSNLVDTVSYADEGDWAVRTRTPPDRTHRGWTWFSEADGFGKSLELINPGVSNDYGQNWASSLVTNGTPGQANSVAKTNVPPLILEVQHLPVVPHSTDPVVITARLLDEHPGGLAATLFWRLDGGVAGFTSVPMADDGLHNDGSGGDGVFGATIPAQANNAIVEFYISASDLEGQGRTWPAPAVETNGVSLGQAANVLYQVDDSAYTGAQPLYKLIMKNADRLELAQIGNGGFPGESQSDAEMNGTFISVDGTGTEARYVLGIRNRGHGSRNRKPNSYRVGFNSDQLWKNVTALNLNGQYTHVQLVGSVLALQAGLGGAESRAVQVRVNNFNLGFNSPVTPVTSSVMFGTAYAANEVPNSEWAEHWYPNDSSGNAYRGIRDIAPSDFSYRGTNKNSYTNTWFKQTNTSEDDWRDLVGMLRVVGTNDLFTTANVRAVADVEQWMTYLAVMALFNNQESTINTGANDDYFLYAGISDPRFLLMYYDLDTILGEGDTTGTTNATIFGATGLPAFNRFLHWPDFEPIYYQTMQRLLNTTFSKAQYDLTVDQTLSGVVPAAVTTRLKTWMDGRRAYVQSVITPLLPPATNPPVATISGEPRSPTPVTSAVLTVGGNGVTQYRYSLNGGAYGPTNSVATPISLAGLAHGSSNVIQVIGAGSAGNWQATSNATVSKAWVVLTTWPAVRINEVLARNVAAFNNGGKYPDAIELYNEGGGVVDLSGLRLTDTLGAPNKFTFPGGTSLAPGGYLVVIAGNSDGTPGLHTGFALNQDGEGVFLYDKAVNGGTLFDSVSFGLQLPDFSLGRCGTAGEFKLCQPTLWATNLVQPLGDPHNLKINEWLASEFAVANTDFVELYNPQALPIALGGLYFTDNPIGEPAKNPVAPLSFIGARDYRVFKADSDPQQGFDHLNFKLASEQGIIALLAADLSVLDLISYGPQRTDVSEGRAPDGANAILDFTQPSPGAPNPASIVGPGTSVVLNEVLANNQTQTNGLGHTPDWVELFNPTLTTVDLSDLSLTDDTTVPRKWVFPAGVSLGAGARLIVECDAQAAISATNTGFGLNAAGDSVHLFRRPADGGTELDAVTFGLQAADYSIGRVPDGSGGWTLTLPTRQSQNVSAGLGNESFLKINEWMAAPSSGSDWFELYNPELLPVALGNLALTDDPSVHDQSPFLPLSYLGAGPDAYRQMIADAHRAGGGDHVAFKLDATGDFIGLYRPSGIQIEGVSFGPQSVDIAQGRFPDGGGAIVNFGATVSPGLPNYLPLTNLVISEVLSHADPPLEDAVEIHNSGSNSVSLDGWYLSNNGSNPRKYQIPTNSMVTAGGYRVYYQYQFDTNAGPEALVPFTFNSAHGDTVLLAQVDSGGKLTGYRAQTSFGPAANGVSFGWFATSLGSEFVAMSARTFGVDAPATVEQFRQGPGAANAYPLVGPVIISEIHFDPTNSYGTNLHSGEFLELRNISSNGVPLYDPSADTNAWKLSGGVDFTFPTNHLTLAAGAALLLVNFDPAANPAELSWFQATYSVPNNVLVLGPYTGALADEGDDLQLFRPDSPQLPPHPDAGFVPYVLVERVRYLPAAPWPTNGIGTGASLQRRFANGFGNEPLNWFAALPSAGRDNLADSDGDGLPDYWEIAHGLNPLVASGADGADGDPDADGFSNRQEYLAGTDPRNGSDFLRITSAALAPGSVTLRFTAAAGSRYAIEYRDSFTGGSWQKLAEAPAGANPAAVEIVDPNPPVGGNRFYRLVATSTVAR